MKGAQLFRWNARVLIADALANHLPPATYAFVADLLDEAGDPLLARQLRAQTPIASFNTAHGLHAVGKGVEK